MHFVGAWQASVMLTAIRIDYTTYADAITRMRIS